MDFAWHPRARPPGPPRGLLGLVPVRDAALALGLLFTFSEPGFDPYHHQGGTVWAAAGGLSAVLLAWRQAAPRPVWLVTTVAAGWLLATRHGADWGGLSPLILTPAALAGLGNLASRTGRRAGQFAAERARIARELHDIVAHHVSVISLQAGTARLLAQAGTPPDPGLLAGIETASRQAMAELRHALGVIRHAPGGSAPPPGLARLPELTAATGLAVTVAEEAAGPGGGPAAPLPASVELTVYRVIQESLTNVLRHSGARAARVTLRRADGVLRVTVNDDGPARPAPAPSGQAADGGGYGLRGLRERVAAQGGSFRAGPAAGGAAPGFEVSVTLPVPGEPGAGGAG